MKLAIIGIQGIMAVNCSISFETLGPHSTFLKNITRSSDSAMKVPVTCVMFRLWLKFDIISPLPTF